MVESLFTSNTDTCNDQQFLATTYVHKLKTLSHDYM